MNKQFDIIDIISVFSFYIAIQNLKENEEQSRILRDKLDEQDNVYLKRAIELLEESIKQNDLIIEENKKLLERK